MHNSSLQTTLVHSSDMPAPAFAELPDLAAAKVGGLALVANDEFFAPKENLLRPETPIFITDKYTDRGKWMDGWESRRSRKPGYDWCIIQLGIPGQIHGFDVYTAFFKGNYPEHCSIEVCEADGNPSVDLLLSAETRWVELVPTSTLRGNDHNYFEINNRQRWTHVRLNIYPDGGVARFRVYGQATPDFSQLEDHQLIELSSIVNGGQVMLCNDMFFSPKENLILPTQAANMGEGWETRRRRDPGNDWVILKLGAAGLIRAIEIDTAHFKGNYVDACSIEGCLLQEDVPTDFLTSRSLDWTPVLPKVHLQADQVHRFENELLAGEQYFSHLRLTIYPDGGISRLRIWGTPSRFERFNNRPLPEVRADLERCCGSSEWVEQMLQFYPFQNTQQVLLLAEQIADQLNESDWLEAFSHHPQIGDLESLKQKFASTAAIASAEQAGSATASDATLKELAEYNQQYFEKFGFIFIVCATGKSADEMLTLLKQRIHHDPETELRIAAAEQRKITRLRLEKLI